MRVTPRDLRGIRVDGLLTRFAILGPVAFVSVEVPDGGSAGTPLEHPTEAPAWGLVMAGGVTLHGPTRQHYPPGTAFHVPGGAPAHWFEAPGRAVIAGFAPLVDDVDTSEEALRARGYEALTGSPAPAPPPRMIAPAKGGTAYRTRGAIDAEVAVMGSWVFMRTSYGPLSGYTSSWCELPHWGIVLSGDLALRFQADVELLSAGDVYYCPAGPGGHRFQVSDAAVTVDYTPLEDLLGSGRKSEWRSAAIRRAGITATLATGGAPASIAPADGENRLSMRRSVESAGRDTAGLVGSEWRRGPRPVRTP